MAILSNKEALFFVTSPRSPLKMVPEIKLLTEKFNGRPWNRETQYEFAAELATAPYYESKLKLETKFSDISARDRINRGPKALGFIDLDPVVRLTEAGNLFLDTNTQIEIFTEQLFKFQLPSPYYIDNNNSFNVKPYLELLRFIRTLEGVYKEEVAIFFLQATHFEKFCTIIDKVTRFRKVVNGINREEAAYKAYVNKEFFKEVSEIYSSRLQSGDIKLRQRNQNTPEDFIETKINNHKDYADAGIRYLLATGLIEISKSTKRILVEQNSIPLVDKILDMTPRQAEGYSPKEFKDYLFTPQMLNLIVKDETQIDDSLTYVNMPYPITGELSDTVDSTSNTEVESVVNGQEIYEPFDPTLIRIESKVSTIDLLVARLRGNEIDLSPDFQRQGDIWTNDARSRLIESLLIRIPIPAFSCVSGLATLLSVVDDALSGLICDHTGIPSYSFVSCSESRD